MKRTVLAMFLIASWAQAELSAERRESYRQVELKQILIAPEDFDHDKVSYEAKFIEFSTTFLPYMERSGFKASKYFGLLIGSLKLPVMAKKSKEMEAFMLTLDKGATVRVYGRLRSFREDPVQTALPRYYLDLDDIVMVTPAATVDQGEDRKPRAVFGGRDRRKKR